MENRIFRYALNASYFLIESIPEWLPKINTIILFGSVIQGRATIDSDVDIFFDADLNKTQKKRLQSALRKSITVYRFTDEALKFKTWGVANEISPIIGKLEEWKSLESSIASKGIILYGPYKKYRLGKHKKMLVVFWDPEIKNRGSFLNKLYGYNIGKKHYKGLIENAGGLKIGKSAIMVPIEAQDKLYKIFDVHEAGYQIVEVFVEQ